jgi:hypothetical protein
MNTGILDSVPETYIFLNKEIKIFDSYLLQYEALISLLKEQIVRSFPDMDLLITSSKIMIHHFKNINDKKGKNLLSN